MDIQNNPILSDLYSYQNNTVSKMFNRLLNKWDQKGNNFKDAIILKSITGSGKTVMLIKLLDLLYEARQQHDLPDFKVIWFSYSPELNTQSKSRFQEFNSLFSGGFKSDLIEVKSDEFNSFQKNKVYFINAQKMSKSAKLSKQREQSGYKTILEHLQEDDECLKVMIFDECHNGMKEKSVVDTFINNYNPNVIVGASATPESFIEYYNNTLNSDYTKEEFETDIASVKESGAIKQKITLLQENKDTDAISNTLTNVVINDYLNVVKNWEGFINEYKDSIKTEHLELPPVIMIQVPNKFENNINEFSSIVNSCVQNSKGLINFDNIYHSIPDVGKIKLNVKNSLGDEVVIPFIKPSSIDKEKKLKVVLFKANLIEGWDCPRAEILYSLRKVQSEKDTAQIMGRILRNPFKTVINDDKYKDLMSVSFYAPKYNNSLIKNISEAINTTGIKIVEDNAELNKTQNYVLEFDGDFKDAINKKNLPTYIKNINEKSDYERYMEADKGPSNKKVEDYAKKIVFNGIDVFERQNIKKAIQETVYSEKYDVESLHSKDYNHEVQNKKQYKLNFEDIHLEFQKLEKTIVAFEDVISFQKDLTSDRLNNCINKVKEIYPEYKNEEHLYEIFWFVVNKDKALKTIYKEVIDDLIAELQGKGIPIQTIKNIDEKIFQLPNNFEKTFSKNRIKKISAQNASYHLIDEKNKVIIDSDSEIEKDAVDYLNQNFKQWSRNYPDKNFLGIKYHHENIDKVFYPDFIGINEHDVISIIETKAKVFSDNIEKLKGALRYCKENNCHLTWIVEDKSKSYYLINFGKAVNEIENITVNNLVSYYGKPVMN